MSPNTREIYCQLYYQYGPKIGGENAAELYIVSNVHLGDCKLAISKVGAVFAAAVVT